MALFIFSFIINFFVLGIISAFISEILSDVLYYIYCFIVIIPSISIAVRRLHDVNKNGWYLLLGLIPIVGIVLLIFLCSKSVEPNNYGKQV